MTYPHLQLGSLVRRSTRITPLPTLGVIVRVETTPNNVRYSVYWMTYPTVRSGRPILISQYLQWELEVICA